MLEGPVCGIQLLLTGIGNPGRALDAYVWEDREGLPGNVLSATTGINPGPVALWPEVSTHDLPIHAVDVHGAYWIGYWADFSSQGCGYYVAADLDGPGGCPVTHIAPGIGYPTGWCRADEVWGPTSALGIGAWTLGYAPTGACCAPDGVCTRVIESDCQGEWLGYGVNCVPNPCDQPMGACCYPDGECVFTSHMQCPNGEWLEGIACDPDPCSSALLGACCLDRICSIMNGAGCHGEWFGPGSSCEPDPCPGAPPGDLSCTNYRGYMRTIGRAELPYWGVDVAVRGDRACALSDFALTVVDVGNPQVPRILGSVTVGGWHGDEVDYAKAVALSPAYAYYVTEGGGMDCTRGGLGVVDLSDPESPQVVAGASLGQCATDLALLGDRAYATTVDRSWSSGTLQVFDLSHGAEPRLVSLLGMPAPTTGVTAFGDLAFVTDERSQLHVISLADLDHPIILASLDGVAGGGLAASQGYVYIAGAGPGFLTIDVSDPSHPRVAGGVATQEGLDLTLAGDYAYAAGWALAVVDISDPEHPKVTGRADVQGANAVAVSGNRAYVLREAFHVVDISNPCSPPVAGSLPLPDAGLGLAVESSYAYVAAASSGLQVIDVSDPAAPFAAASAPVPGSANAVAVSGGYACLTWTGAPSPPSGLEVIDVTDPEHPAVAGLVATAGTATCVAVSGGFAYVGDEQDAAGHLQIVDLADPHHPQVAGIVATPGRVTGVAVSGPLAFVVEDRYSGHRGSLQTIDVSDPQVPRILSTLETTGYYSSRVAVSGDIVYAEIGALYAVDVSDPYNPRLISEAPGGLALTIAGDVIYQIGLGGNTLQAVDASGDRHLQMIGSTGAGGSAVAAAGSWVYLGGVDGLCVLPGHCEPSASPPPSTWPSPTGVRVIPNPASEEVTIALDVPASGEVLVNLHDVSGRLVRRLRQVASAPGRIEMFWNRRDDHGRLAPSGLYVARVSTAAGTRTARVVLLR